VFSCPKIALEVRMYSLRSPIGRILSGTFGGRNSGRFGAFWSHGRSNIPLTWEVRDCAGSVLSIDL